MLVLTTNFYFRYYRSICLSYCNEIKADTTLKWSSTYSNICCRFTLVMTFMTYYSPIYWTYESILFEKCEKMICRKLTFIYQKSRCLYIQKIADLLRFHIHIHTTPYWSDHKYWQIHKEGRPPSLIMKSLIAGLLFCCIYSTYFGI